MVYRKRKRNEEPMEIFLRKKIVPNKDSTQFMGMNLEEHIERVRVLNTIKVVAGKKWGGDHRTLKKLYSAVCRSKMDYGCQLCSTASPRRLK